jgi:hypothetical protein
MPGAKAGLGIRDYFSICANLRHLRIKSIPAQNPTNHLVKTNTNNMAIHTTSKKCQYQAQWSTAQWRS